VPKEKGGQPPLLQGKYMKILDLSAGKRAQWYNKQHPLTTYVDIRPEMVPDIVCDTRSLPFEDASFDLISFDPPHMCCGPASNMAAQYGHWTTSQILETVEGTSKEAWRVAKPECLLTLKWNDHDIKLGRVINLMPQWEPLYGQTTAVRGKHPSATTWTLFKRN
jgi:hypothetical protein